MLLRALRQTIHFKPRLVLAEKLMEEIYKDNPMTAVCQMTSTNDKHRNYLIVANLVNRAKEQNAGMIFLPEGCDFISNNTEESLTLAEGVNGPLMQSYCALARTNKIWMSIGGFHERSYDLHEVDKIYNTHFIIDKNGTVVARYRKLHLFDVDLPERNLKIQESDAIAPGTFIKEPVYTPVGRLGLATCYDVRFPEMSTLLRKNGATVLTYPAAFTRPTGELHWETLLRARAIENQCYVLAAAQYGPHNERRSSYGGAMIVDPMGVVLGKCSEYDGTDRDSELIFAVLSDAYVSQTRAEMPVFSHRRTDVYTLTGSVRANVVETAHTYIFSDIVIPNETVFFETVHSFAFVNIRCVVPGHVLVATKRNVPRLHNIPPEEMADLFQTVNKVQRVVEDVYSCSSSTIVVQDGEDAGQTIKHVHVHILPRKQGDFQRNDDIYDVLARHDNPDSEMPRRSYDVMLTEALMLRAKFCD